MDGVPPAPHPLAAVPCLDPDAAHARLHLAESIGTNAAAGAVAHGLGAVHRAGHSGIAERALAAHLAIEQHALDRALDRGNRPLQALVADPAQEGIEGDQRPLEAFIEGLEAARVARRPEAHLIHRSQTAAGAAAARIGRMSLDAAAAETADCRSP